MHLVEQVDLIGRLKWECINTLDERADSLNAIVARGIYLIEIAFVTADLAREDARD